MPESPILEQRTESGSVVHPCPGDGCWRLTIQPGSGNHYHWAQLDDYASLPRSKFLWSPPVTLDLEARVSAHDLSGTWGFGFWNDPFNASLGFGGAGRRLPALPNTAWFFNASPPNYLSFRDDLPAQGFLVATFRSAQVPLPLMALGAPFLPFLKWPWMAKKLRRLAGRFICQSAALLEVDVTQWHRYALEWRMEGVTFCVDGEEITRTDVSPYGPLGLVLWIDNQYAAFTPAGKVSFGTLENKVEGWLELKEIRLS